LANSSGFQVADNHLRSSDRGVAGIGHVTRDGAADKLRVTQRGKSQEGQDQNASTYRRKKLQRAHNGTPVKVLEISFSSGTAQEDSGAKTGRFGWPATTGKRTESRGVPMQDHVRNFPKLKGGVD
jgi:hypothetical protein